MTELDQLSINALRFLAVDAVEKANSGHPGAPLGDSPITYLLFHKYMRHNPANSNWTDRDRFVLSNGHASAMLYSALYLAGYKLSIEDLKQFRQYDSHTPGHPELGAADGVEVTTGPLGQGLGMSVGMAAAERHLAARYNRPGFEIVNHYTYVMCGDGDLMEGVSHEACSFAGTLGLGKLILFYDDNLVSLDGPTDLSFSENVEERFDAYHWHVQRVADGNDLEALEKAIDAAKAVTDKPSIIAVRTVIGYGSPKAGTSKAHGEPLGAEDTKKTKEKLGWPAGKSFYVPEEAAKNWSTAKERGAKLESDWNGLFARYKQQFPELAAEYQRVFRRQIAAGVGSRRPEIPGQLETHGHAGCGRHRVELDRAKSAGADRRRRRPVHLHQNYHQGQPQLPRRSERPQHLLRRARIWHVLLRQWHGRPWRSDPVWLHVFLFQRLRPPRPALGRANAGAVHLCLHA